MPRSALRPPAARMVGGLQGSGRALPAVEGGSTALMQRPVSSPLPPTWVAGAFRCEIECVGSAWRALLKIVETWIT